jgi:hypothetical protein
MVSANEKAVKLFYIRIKVIFTTSVQTKDKEANNKKD